MSGKKNTSKHEYITGDADAIFCNFGEEMRSRATKFAKLTLFLIFMGIYIC